MEMQLLLSKISVKPSSPPKLMLCSRGCRKISFEIVYSEPFQNFEIEIFSENTNNKWEKIGESTGTILYYNNLEPNTNYDARARIKLLNGSYSDYSEKISFKTLKGKI